MSLDFTIEVYIKLLGILQQQTFQFLPFQEFITHNEGPSICLRHDVDLLPKNSLEFARIQHSCGIRGTYYFRAVPESWDEKIIKEIQSLNHEIGYHYENLTTTKGDLSSAIHDFEVNLNKLRNLVPVSTICMHGSPRSRFDSKDLWKEVDYVDYKITSEPYFDLDFSNVLYLTDTGRRWNGNAVSVRDKVGKESKKNKIPIGESESWKHIPTLNSSLNMGKEAIEFQKNYDFQSTFDFIAAADKNLLPSKIMMTFHPQRWSDNKTLWVKEFVWQNVKNLAKYIIVKGQ